MLKMFSVYYKEIPYSLPAGWVDSFAVGDLAENENYCTFRDEGDGDSIAGLNSSFGELTAHYWVWKNLKNAQYVGFCHYRRYFNFIANPQIHFPKLLASPSPDIMNFINQDMQRDMALKILQTSDVIATRQYCLEQTVREQYCDNHPSYVWDEFVKAIGEKSPLWLSSYLPWFELSREYHFYPVFITRWEIFDEFCSLLFDVLFLVYQRVGELAEDGADVRFHQKRYPAYLSERFMMLYFHAKGLRIHGAQLIALEQGA